MVGTTKGKAAALKLAKSFLDMEAKESKDVDVDSDFSDIDYEELQDKNEKKVRVIYASILH